MKKVVVVGLIALLSACATVKGDFRVDGSSAESTRNGIETISNKLSMNERVNLMVALMAIQFSNVKSAHEVVADKSLQNANYDNIGSKINGLTYKEILELAKKSPTKVEVQKN